MKVPRVRIAWLMAVIALNFGVMRQWSLVSKLISITKKLGKEGAKLQLRSLHPDLREVFRLCRLDQVFETEE